MFEVKAFPRFEKCCEPFVRGSYWRNLASAVTRSDVLRSVRACSLEFEVNSKTIPQTFSKVFKTIHVILGRSISLIRTNTSALLWTEYFDLIRTLNLWNMYWEPREIVNWYSLKVSRDFIWKEPTYQFLGLQIRGWIFGMGAVVLCPEPLTGWLTLRPNRPALKSLSGAPNVNGGRVRGLGRKA